MSQDEGYKILLSMMQGIRLEDTTMDITDCPPTQAILNHPKVAGESFDKLQNQKEDDQDNMHITSDQCSRNKLVKLDAAMLEFSACGSHANQVVGEALNAAALDRQQKYGDLIPEYDYTNIIEFMPSYSDEGYLVYRSILNEIYEKQYETAEKNCEVSVAKLMNGAFTEKHYLLIVNHGEIMALIYRKTIKYDRAKKLLSLILEVHRFLLGDNDRVVAITLNNLGICLGVVGNFVEAHNLCESALQIILEKRQMIQRQTIANQLYCLGALHQMQDHYNSAAEYYVQALNHYELRSVLQNLTTCYRKQGKVQEAESLQNRFRNGI